MNTQSHTLAYLTFKFHNSYWKLRYLVIDLWTICYSVYLIWKTRRQQKYVYPSLVFSQKSDP